MFDLPELVFSTLHFICRNHWTLIEISQMFLSSQYPILLEMQQTRTILSAFSPSTIHEEKASSRVFKHCCVHTLVHIVREQVENSSESCQKQKSKWENGTSSSSYRLYSSLFFSDLFIITTPESDLCYWTFVVPFTYIANRLNLVQWSWCLYEKFT